MSRITIAEAFDEVRIWASAHLLKPLEHDAEAVVHTVEKEIKAMADLPQNILDALGRIKANNGQVATLKAQIKTLTDSNTALQGQVNDLTTAAQKKDQQITDLTQARDDAIAQLNDLETAVLAADPAPPAQAAA